MKIIVKMDEKICRLCMNTICTSDFQPIEDWRDILNELILNLNLAISNKAVVCSACVNNLQICINLKKSSSVNSVDTKFSLPDIKISKLDPEEASDTNINLIGNQNQKICRFCRKSLGPWDVISLNETKENIFLVDLLQKHIPEWNLNHADDLLTCCTCLDFLKIILNFITNCLDVEEKIKRYIEIEGTNGRGQIELNDVQKFTFKPVSKYEADCGIKEEDDNCEENMIVETVAEIKREAIEIVNTDLNIKPEELDIVLKEDDCESPQEPPATIEIDNGSLDMSVFKSQTLHAKFKCDMCNYGTERKKNLRRHKLVHKSPAERTKFKCDLCSYEAKWEYNLKRHKLAHKRPTEVTKFKCYLCPYEAKFKDYLIRHTLTHKSPSKFKCDLCPYEAKCKTYLRHHKLVHKSPSEVKKFKCDLCTYEAKRKHNLKRHKSVHNNEIKFKCNLCPYEAKHKINLNRHELIHKGPTEITKFKCDLCPYEAKFKDCLIRHTLAHKSISKFKCDFCPYEATRNYDLTQHKLSHKGPVDVTIFKCEFCSYEAKHQSYLNRHRLTHKCDVSI